MAVAAPHPVFHPRDQFECSVITGGHAESREGSFE
jgi:hypothetical protein